MSDAEIAQAIRALAADWRPLMDDIRRVAAELPDIRATQKGVEVDAQVARGPIRLALRSVTSVDADA